MESSRVRCDSNCLSSGHIAWRAIRPSKIRLGFMSFWKPRCTTRAQLMLTLLIYLKRSVFHNVQREQKNHRLLEQSALDERKKSQLVFRKIRRSRASFCPIIDVITSKSANRDFLGDKNVRPFNLNDQVQCLIFLFRCFRWHLYRKVFLKMV